MAWKETETTIEARKYPREIDKLFRYFSSEINSKKMNNIYVADGGNSMKLKSYGREGVDANVELDISKDQFDSVCSIIPGVLSGIDTYKKEDHSLVMELNLGKVAKGEGGIETSFVEHIVYNSDFDGKDFQVSLVFPENIRRKLENYGNCSAVDIDLPEGDLALLIKEAALKDGFEELGKVYDCVTPVCPPPMKMDQKELTDFIKKSPGLKLEGRYFENKKYGGKSELVLADITQNHISLEGLLYESSKLDKGKSIYPILGSVGIAFNPGASVALDEKYDGFLESMYKKLTKHNRRRNESEMIYSKRHAAREDAVSAAFGAALTPFVLGYNYLDKQLGFEEERKAKMEKAARENDLRDFFERTLSKGGVKRPDGNTCLAVINKKCLIDKFNEKKKQGDGK